MPYLIDCADCKEYTPPSHDDKTICQLCYDEREAVKHIQEFLESKEPSDSEKLFYRTKFIS